MLPPLLPRCCYHSVAAAVFADTAAAHVFTAVSVVIDAAAAVAAATADVHADTAVATVDAVAAADAHVITAVSTLSTTLTLSHPRLRR